MLIKIATQGDTPTRKALHKQRSFPTFTSYPRISLSFLITSVTILILLQIKAIHLFSPSSSWKSLPHLHHEKHAQTTPFLPLKDLRLASTAMEGNTWFMSSLNDTFEEGEAEHLFFPSQASNDRLLCMSGRDTRNGTNNYYSLAPKGSLPPNAKLLPGLTFMSDTYYDYENLFHGLTALAPFVSWHGRKDCVRPKRWVLYHWGELRQRMSPWLANVLQSVFGEPPNIETFEGSNSGSSPSCFERAVVLRHNEGAMSRESKEATYGLMRCKARAYCNVSREVNQEKAIRFTLLLRKGSRSFKDDAAVARIFDEECKKVDGCRFKVSLSNNLTFCDQVKLMSNTDILASPHGAQMTNLFFMNKNSSVMEFFPKGWKEFAGVGQYVFHWISGGSGIRHTGTWNDPNGEKCPYIDESKCFSFYKDGRIGHDEEYFAKWAAEVLIETSKYKLTEESMIVRHQQGSCLCT